MANEENKKCFGLILLDKNNNKYLNLYICHLNLGLIFAYIYIIASSLSSIITRIIFHYYQFKFNFALFFLEQSICTIIFTFIKKEVKFEFQSFLKYAYFYIY